MTPLQWRGQCLTITGTALLGSPKLSAKPPARNTTERNHPPSLILRWVKDDDEQYFAYSGDRTYIVRLFNVGAYDGDPTLTMYDDRYRSTCWSLTTRVGIVTRNPVRLFNDRSSALFAAQQAEDNARDHQRQHPDMDDPPGRHRQGVRGDHIVTITGRDGKTYTYRTRRHRRSDRGEQGPVARR